MASPKFRMLINGRLVPGAAGTFSVINPSTGKSFAECPKATKDQLDEAVQGAKAAFPAWAALPHKDRSAALLAASGKVVGKLQEISEVLTREQGKPLQHAQGEMKACAYYLKHFAGQTFEPEKVVLENAKEKVVQRRVPVGVVAGITPWNFPPLMGVQKICEAVSMGNTIIVKPSPYTPLSTLMIGELLADVFPAGVVNVVTGGDEVGAWLTENKDVAKVSFTGSTRTGKAIQAAASSSLKHLTLELGGNDPAIIMEDADPKAVAMGVASQAFGNAGQICIAVKRCYVHESKFDAVVGELTKIAKGFRVGDGFEEGVHMGPINNKMQFDRVSGLVEDAKKDGARVHAGGEAIPGNGYYYPPTIVTGVKEGTRLVDEEQFGPVLPVMPFKTVEEAVQRANDTNYGLGASVWGTDVAKAAEVASQIEAGTVWVNSHGGLSADVPFGGLKESGIGKQMGDATVEALTETKFIRIPKSKL